MVGADPKFQTCDRASLVAAPGVKRPVLERAPRRHTGSPRLRMVAMVCVLVPLSLVLVIAT